MDVSAVAFAYGAGLLAAFNPCGFVLLPTYAAAFLADDPQGGLRAPLGVSARLTAGFLTVFLVAGLLVGALGASTRGLGEAASWLGVVIGAALVALGLLTFVGRKLPSVNIRIGSTRTSYSYGIGYAIASLACALPVFLGAVVHAFDRGGLLTGVASGGSYAAGMGTVITAVVFLTAGTRKGAVNRLRRIGRWFDRLAGALLVAAGITLVVRRWVELRLLEDLSGTTVQWLDQRRWVPVAVLVLAALVTLARRTLTHPRTPSTETPTTKTPLTAENDSKAEGQ